MMGTVAVVDASHVEIDTKDGKKVSVFLNKERSALEEKRRLLPRTSKSEIGSW